MEKQQANNNNMRIRDCLFGIQLNIILALIGLGVLQPIVCKKAVSAKGVHKDSTNAYFRIAHTNLVWMHVQDGYGIITNEYVISRTGKEINLIEVLSQYYWYIENRTGIIKCFTLDNRAIYRCIMSIILYDNVHVKMPKWLEVHHKWWKWCNTQNAIAETCHRKHQYFHNYINSRKSHQRGILICNEEEMLRWKNVIFVENAKLKNQPM